LDYEETSSRIKAYARITGKENGQGEGDGNQSMTEEAKGGKRKISERIKYQPFVLPINYSKLQIPSLGYGK